MADEPIHVLNLPQLYQKPDYSTLLSTLDLLYLTPPTFSSSSPTPSPPTRRPVHPAGITDYLTKIIASHLSWLPNDAERECIWDIASERLAERAGRTAMGDITREFLIPTRTEGEGDSEITLKLYEPALTGDNLGLKTWSSSFVLAKLLHKLELPELILHPGQSKDHTADTDADTNSHKPPTSQQPSKKTQQTGTTKPPLIIDLGSGTGLAGLAAAAALWPHCDTLLTDLPEIETNLARNICINRDILHLTQPLGTAAKEDGGRKSEGRTVTSGVLDWTNPARLILRTKLPTEVREHLVPLSSPDPEPASKGKPENRDEHRIDTEVSLLSSNPSPGTATLLLAADPIYSPSHPALLAQTVRTWLEPCRDSRFILAHPHREAYTPQIAELRRLLADNMGTVATRSEGLPTGDSEASSGERMELEVEMEGVEKVWDDWDDEVEVAWSVWRWKGIDQ